MAQALSPATRDRILVFLHENRVVSVKILSQAWGLTRADIRYHLSALVEEGLLEPVPAASDKPARRGRPEQMYRLTTGKAPDNFAVLCETLLDYGMRLLPENEPDLFLNTLASQMGGAVQPASNATQHLNQAVAFLDQHGYRARWEAHADGPRILLRNCPYAAILHRHPELCTLDRHLVEHLTGIPVQQTAQMNLATGKPPACIFIARSPR